MATKFIRTISSLDLEDRILNGASLFALVSVFLPWLSGEWLGEDFVSYSGFEFFTSLIGITIFLLHVTLLCVVLVPAVGGPQIVRRKHREVLRLCLASQATILALAALSVLTKVTYDYTRMDIRFGIYCTFIGSLIATFYAFWKLQEQRKSEVHEIFHHPDVHEQIAEQRDSTTSTPPPPPPPRPLEPEDHRIRP